MNNAMNTTPVRHRRLERLHRQVRHHLERDELDAAERLFVEFKFNHGEPESSWERWCDLVDSLLANPPYLHPGEREFLENIAVRLERSTKEPSERQAAWIKKIERRRRS